MVDVEVDESLPDGLRHLADILKRGIIDGAVDPFRGPIRDQAGTLRCGLDGGFSPEELIKMDWLCDAVDGSIPAFDELLPQSQRLVRLLGLHRETIPPVVEDAQL